MRAYVHVSLSVHFEKTVKVRDSFAKRTIFRIGLNAPSDVFAAPELSTGR